MAKASDVIKVMQGWLGWSEANKKYLNIMNIYNEHKPLARGYAIKPQDEWCACTISAAAIKAKATDIIGTEVSCEKFVEIFKSKGIWIEDGKITPKVGDIVLYNWDDKTQENNGYSDHIGIVESVNGKSFVVIEGNMDEKVGRRTVQVGWGYIRGFARPKYDKEVAKTTKKSNTQIAKEVIEGKWGNGQKRKDALTKAGYNYAAVQKEVTAILEAKSNVKKTDYKIAKEVIEGKWGNGQARINALIKAGYDPKVIQDKVNKLLG